MEDERTAAPAGAEDTLSDDAERQPGILARILGRSGDDRDGEESQDDQTLQSSSNS